MSVQILSRRSTGATHNERVGRCLKRTQTRTNNEHGTTEATKRPLHPAGPEEQGTHAVDAETGDERPSVAEFAHDPAAVCEGTDEVGSKVCTVLL